MFEADVIELKEKDLKNFITRNSLTKKRVSIKISVRNNYVVQT